MNAPSFGSWNDPVSPVGGVSSPVRYEFDFSASPGRGPFGSQQSSERWPYSEPFPTSSQSILPTGTYEPPSTVDPSFLGYCPPSSQVSTDFFGTSNTTAAGSSFVPGLPFHGLDYLRNFDPDGGEKDALEQGFDAGAFQYDPEIPFTLPDLDTKRAGQ